MAKITDFLQSNRLCINQAKTKTQNFMVYQKRARVEDDPEIMIIEMQEGQKTVSNTKHGRILGLNLEDDLGWRSQLETGPKPLLPCLRKRVGQLRHIGRQIPKKGRLILANGLIVSKVIYMIQVWGGVQNTHLKKIQKILNSAARYVIMGGRNWRSLKLMTTCNWLTAKELVDFHTLMLLWKILNFSKPKVLAEKFEKLENGKITGRLTRLKITEKYFVARSVTLWNNLTDNLRDTTTISGFKTRLRKHILDKRGVLQPNTEIPVYTNDPWKLLVRYKKQEKMIFTSNLDWDN